MTHLGLGSSLEEPWLELLGGVEEGVPSLEVAQASGEGWAGWCLGECLVPCLLALGGLLLCPAWDALEELLVTGGELAWEELFSSLAVVELGWGGELPASEGRCAAPGRELLPSPGGRWAIAGVWLRGGTWLAWLFVWLLTELLVLLVVLLVVLLLLLAWLLRKLFPSGGRWTAARGELSPSPGGRRAVAGVGLWERELGGDWTYLFRVVLLLIIVIFPSFLDTKWFSLLICLCFTLLNLSSLTLLMKPWHCSNLSCKMIEASLALQSCISLSTWSRILLIALTLACSKSFSAFLIICLAFGVSKVDFNLILTGINSSCIHLREKILWFL